VALTLFATVAFLIAPIVLTVVASFAASWTGVLPSGFVTFENWRAVLGLADTIGFPAQYGMEPAVQAPARRRDADGVGPGGVGVQHRAGARRRPHQPRRRRPHRVRGRSLRVPGQRGVNAVSVLPLVPGVILGVAFLRAYPDLSATSFGLIVGYSLLKAPFMVMAVQSEFESMPPGNWRNRRARWARRGRGRS
jgi:putative spermidine/putrescine transport system permease protein